LTRLLAGMVESQRFRDEGRLPPNDFACRTARSLELFPQRRCRFVRSDRSRLTADGLWYLCLYAGSGVDLRKPLRMDESQDRIRDIIRSGWVARRDRGAEERKALERVGLRAGGLIDIDRLREDPHLEMHARGG
jgi:cyclic pyranopterin phosphate synthase